MPSLKLRPSPQRGGLDIECESCQTTTFSSDVHSDAAPVQSQSCGHSVCRGCVTGLHLVQLEKFKKAAFLLRCPLCKTPQAFDGRDPHINLVLCGLIGQLERWAVEKRTPGRAVVTPLAKLRSAATPTSEPSGRNLARKRLCMQQNQIGLVPQQNEADSDDQSDVCSLNEVESQATPTIAEHSIWDGDESDTGSHIEGANNYVEDTQMSTKPPHGRDLQKMTRKIFSVFPQGDGSIQEGSEDGFEDEDSINGDGHLLSAEDSQGQLRLGTDQSKGNPEGITSFQGRVKEGGGRDHIVVANIAPRTKRQRTSQSQGSTGAADSDPGEANSGNMLPHASSSRKTSSRNIENDSSLLAEVNNSTNAGIAPANVLFRRSRRLTALSISNAVSRLKHHLVAVSAGQDTVEELSLSSYHGRYYVSGDKATDFLDEAVFGEFHPSVPPLEICLLVIDVIRTAGQRGHKKIFKAMFKTSNAAKAKRVADRSLRIPGVVIFGPWLNEAEQIMLHCRRSDASRLEHEGLKWMAESLAISIVQLIREIKFIKDAKHVHFLKKRLHLDWRWIVERMLAFGTDHGMQPLVHASKETSLHLKNILSSSSTCTEI